MESFYITLPSNSSQDFFPDNKLHSFKVKLHKPLPVSEGKWEVGLTEIMFPKSWYNLTDAWIIIKSGNDSLLVQRNVQDGYYPSVKELIHCLHTIIESVDLDGKIVLEFDEIQNRVRLKISEHESTIGITFSQNILNMLGLSKKQGEFYSTGWFIEKATDINEGFSALYVYTDVVESQLVGDVMVPLIRVVPFKNNNKREDTWVNFPRVQYLPVRIRETDSIEIVISRDNGEIIPFQKGKVVVTLHFRRLPQ